MRGRHGATLTSFGSQLFVKAKSILQSHDNFLSYAKQLNQSEQQFLSIGFNLSSFVKVPLWIDQFSKCEPNCEVRLNHLPSSIQIDMLLEGSLQIGFVRLPVDNELATQVICHEMLALAIPENYPKDLSNSLQEILNHYSLYQLDNITNPCLTAQTEQFLQSNLLRANKIFVKGDQTTLLALVASGNAVTLIPQSMQQFLPANVKLLIPEQNTVQWEIAMVWNPKINNDYRDNFIKIVNTQN